MNPISKTRIKYKWMQPYTIKGEFRWWMTPLSDKEYPYDDLFDKISDAIESLKVNEYEKLAKEENWHLIEVIEKPIVFHNGVKLMFNPPFNMSAEPDEDRGSS